MKTVKTMNLFFDQLYATIGDIDATVLTEWSHKETPKQVHCVIEVTDMNETVIDRENAIIFTDLNDAIEEMNDWNE
ncbi:hypothetical protein [Bacillus cereus]|uniref:hypothetical protein n=1 Tax=Bacillus cereus TaxID=1396 RepID=UPI002D77EAF3|nr:hypothetical protein [Bacillus cereus]